MDLPIVTCSMDGSFRRRQRPWVLLWPGLYRLWCQGHPAGLGAAVLQAALLNTVLVSSFVWTALLPASHCGWDCGVCAVVSGCSAAWMAFERRPASGRPFSWILSWTCS